MEGFHFYFTSDTHGAVFPVSYATGEEKRQGLLNLAQRVQRDGNTLILDGGDSLQGSPLIAAYLEDPSACPVHPVAAALNALGVQYFTLGNHDFNFGYDALADFLDSMEGQCVCANVVDLQGRLPIVPECIHCLENGLRIGITAAVTDFVPIWERPEHLAFFRILDAETALRDSCARLQEQGVDCLICLYHGGFERDLVQDRLLASTKENLACHLAEVLPLQLLLTGHQHLEVPGCFYKDTWVLQCPPNACKMIEGWGFLEDAGRWSWKSEAVLPAEHPHEEVYSLLLPFEHKVQQELDRVLLELDRDFPDEGYTLRALGQHAWADWVNEIQLRASAADFSCTNMGNMLFPVHHKLRLREILQLYPFANTLEVLEVSREDLIAALERCGTYLEWSGSGAQVSSAFLSPKVEHYNYDFYAGLDYAFDLSRAPGARLLWVRDLEGKDLGSGPFRLALNNYRATGTGGYEHFRNCKVLAHCSDDLQALIVEGVRTVPCPRLRGGASWYYKGRLLGIEDGGL